MPKRFNVAFFINFDKTFFFHAIAQQLIADDYAAVSWISNKPAYTRWLIDNGVSKADILDLTFTKEKREKFINHPHFEKEKIELIKLEPKLRVGLNYLILMDRKLRYRNRDFAFDYLVFVYSKLKEFYIEKKVDTVFSEVTHAAEALASDAAAFLRVKHYHIAQLTIPGNRYAFFEGSSLKKVVPISKGSGNSINWTFYAKDLIKKNTKPYTFVYLSKTPKFKVAFIKKFFKHAFNTNFSTRGDQTAITVFDLIKTNLTRIINSRLESSLIKFADVDKQENFFLYLMQRQPEATIDLYAGYHANQVEVIKNICRCLPASHYLYIKLHPNGIGEFPFRDLKRISKLPRVRIVKYNVESGVLIDKSQAVITVNGTVGIEASLKERQVFILDEYYYEKMKNVKHVKNFYELRNSINEFISDRSISIEETDEALHYLYENSLDGIIGDPITTPGCLDQDNISNIVNGVKRILQKYSGCPSL